MLEYEGGIVRDTLIPRRSLKLGETIRIKPLKVIEEVRNRNFDFSNGFVVGMHKYCGKVGK